MPRPSSLTRRDWLRVAGGAAGVAVLPWPLLGRERSADPLSPREVEPDLVWHDRAVPNGEPDLAKLVEGWKTPVERFFVRSHGKTPKVELGSFRLNVTGLVERSLELTVDELRAMDATTTTATLTCAGNRRVEHSAVKKVVGVQWRAGAIGNAEWTGVPLAALLKQAGVRDGAKHVWFEGRDEVDHEGETIGFGGSIPIEKALAGDDGRPGALVAWLMNGEPLSPDHGFPLRTVVPGYIGARSVKWVDRIVVADEPSPNHFVADAYKVVQRTTPLDWAEAGPIYTFPVNSAIATAARARQGPVTATGYALPPGDGRTIAKVEVSTDEGHTWNEAEITSEREPYCWVLWTARVQTAGNTLVVRATDSEGLVQPRDVPWNTKGYLFNAWHRVPLDGT